MRASPAQSAIQSSYGAPLPILVLVLLTLHSSDSPVRFSIACSIRSAACHRAVASLGQLLVLIDDHPIVYTLEEPKDHSALD